MSYSFNPFTGNFDAVTTLSEIDRLTSITATAGDTFALTSDGVTETLAFSRGRGIINRSGGTNDLSFASTGIGVRVAPGSIGATFHVEGSNLFNLTDSHANPFEITVGGVPYVRFVTSAGARTLEFRGNVKLSNVDCNWEGHFLPVDTSSAYDIGGTPANYWRNAYFVGTVFATGGLNATASATQAASIFMKADAAQNATVTIQDSASNNLFAINAASSNVTFNVDEVIVMDGTITRVKMGQVAGSPDQSHIVLYDGNDPGSPIWWMYSAAASSQVGNWIQSNNFYIHHYPAGVQNGTSMWFNTGAGAHWYLQTDWTGAVGFASRCTITAEHGANTNAGDTSAAIKLAAQERIGAASGPLLVIAYGNQWGSSLAADERVRFNAQGVSLTQWALGTAGESYQSGDAHIRSDSAGLMLGAGTAGGAGDVRVYYDGSNCLFDNLIGTGSFRFVDGKVQVQTTDTTGNLSTLCSSTTPGVWFRTGGTAAERVWSCGQANTFGFEMTLDESATGDMFLRRNSTGVAGTYTQMIRYFRGTGNVLLGTASSAFGVSVGNSLMGEGQIYMRRGGHMNYDQNSSANSGNFVASSVNQTYMLYVDATNDAIGFGTTATTGGTLNYAAGRISTNKAGTFISCAGVSDNFLLWFSANAYSGAGSYGWGYQQEEASYGDHQFFRHDGGALVNVMYYKRSNGRVGIGPGWTGASPPQYMVDVVGDIHASTEVEIGGDLDHNGTNLGFFNVALTTRPSAYTQTYATATRTHSNLTSATLTDSSGGTANTTIQALPDPSDLPPDADALRDDLVANLIPALRNNYADLAAQVNALIVDLTNTKQVLNQVIDDHQLNGLLQ